MRDAQMLLQPQLAAVTEDTVCPSFFFKKKVFLASKLTSQKAQFVPDMKITVRDQRRMYVFMQILCHFCTILNKMRPQILVKALNSKPHIHPSHGSRSITYRTDRHADGEIRSPFSHTTAPKQLRM